MNFTLGFPKKRRSSLEIAHNWSHLSSCFSQQCAFSHTILMGQIPDWIIDFKICHSYNNFNHIKLWGATRVDQNDPKSRNVIDSHNLERNFMKNLYRPHQKNPYGFDSLDTVDFGPIQNHEWDCLPKSRDEAWADEPAPSTNLIAPQNRFTLLPILQKSANDGCGCESPAFRYRSLTPTR